MKRIPAALTALLFAFAITTSCSQILLGKSDYPITRDTLNRYPDSLIVEGSMTDYNLGVPCGVLCGCGAIKIKLTDPHPLYKELFIYVGMPCFNKLPDSLKQKQTWALYKIPINDTACFWTEAPVNKFDSKGVPFYTMQ